MRKLTAAFIAAAAVAVAAPASAAEFVTDYQFYVLGNSTLNGNGTNGRMAVGGNASFISSSIGGATSANPYSLVVGGDLTYGQSGGSVNGGALIGGSANVPHYISVTNGALPVDFTAENMRLKNLSDTLGGKTATGSTEAKWGGLYLTGSNSDLNVFNLTSAQMAQAGYFNFNIASGSQVLINVFGDNISMTGGFDFGNTSNVLWNFVDATNLRMGNIGLGGTVLAPDATFTGNGGTIAGKLIVGNFNGAMSFGNAGYGGNFLTAPPPVVAPTPPVEITPPTGGFPVLTPVPEPGAWMLMILGFGAIGAAMRRRRATLVTA